MPETLSVDTDIEDIDTDGPLRGEPRFLRDKKASILGRIAELTNQREAIKNMPPLQRLKLIGARVIIFNELSQRQSELRAIEHREASYDDFQARHQDEYTLDDFSDSTTL